ncbi:OmpA/MotB protein [Candidatus Sulfopaludibacter sp. SbA3]|nr:OmpA/MotB protein [Candidatus Sulfopaludibacter sp. SbA3]
MRLPISQKSIARELGMAQPMRIERLLISSYVAAISWNAVAVASSSQPVSKYFYGECPVKITFSNAVSHVLTAVSFSLFSLTASISYAQQDKLGCKDLPYLSRFPGSGLMDCSHSDDDTFKFWVTVSSKDQQKTVEGKFDKLYYSYPQTASRPQLIRNFNTALSAAGYKKLYDSGPSGDSTWNKAGLWIFISISGAPHYEVYAVQEVALTQDVVATATELGSGIGGTGHAVVPGILFDTGKADLKPESSKALDEVAKLLSEHADWKIYVVGHTDNVGQLGANMDLSKRRAEAVVQALATQYHLAAARLGSFGAGPYAPVASNDKEEGRTQNRRVEIVKQ